MTCFVPSCPSPVVLTRSWRTDAGEGVYGPTYHACATHKTQLLATRDPSKLRAQLALALEG